MVGSWTRRWLDLLPLTDLHCHLALVLTDHETNEGLGHTVDATVLGLLDLQLTGLDVTGASAATGHR